MIAAVLVLVAAVSTANAQHFAWGKCPDVELKKDFDVTKYTGKWYDIEHFYAVFQAKGGNCICANYTLNADNSIGVYNRGITDDKQLIGIRGRATCPDPVNNKAKFDLKFDGVPFKGAYWVLNTDYDNYSIVYTCSSFFFFHVEYGWILSRTPALDKPILENARKQLSSYGIKVEKFQKTNQDAKFCPVI